MIEHSHGVLEPSTRRVRRLAIQVQYLVAGWRLEGKGPTSFTGDPRDGAVRSLDTTLGELYAKMIPVLQASS